MTIFGWDMSHFDAPSIGGAIGEGISFITHKAGGDATDPELPAWWAGVHTLDRTRVLLGAYWVLLPGSPAARADGFLARLDAACGGWRDRPFLLQVDCEKWNGNAATVPGRAEIKTFCDRLVARAPKLWPVVYAPKWVYGDSLAGLGYPLWASSYVTGVAGFRSLYPGDASSRWGAYSGQTPAILQYTSSAIIGGQTTCDANAYRGTFDELVALVAPGWSTDVALTTDDIWNADVVTNPSQRSNAKSDPQQRAAFALGDAWQLLYDLRGAVATLDAKVTALPLVFGQDEVAVIVSGVLAGLTPEVLAAIPADLAQQVVDVFSARTARPA